MATKLFADFPAAASAIPGTVTPQITQDIRTPVNWSELATAYALQRRMKEDRANDWARAAAANRANAAPPLAEHYLPGTASQTSGMGYGQQGGQGPVLWAPRGLGGPKLGTWASQQQNRAVAENREMPTVLQAHTGDPWSPGEQGGGGNYLGRGIFGPGLTSPSGTSNPASYALWLQEKFGSNNSAGRTGAGKADNPFPEESLWERTNPKKQYEYR